MITRQARNVDIASVYHRLVPMVSSEVDINRSTQESLIDLHISLMAMNELLEKRLPAMQKNCMKGQPDIVGGCRE